MGCNCGKSTPMVMTAAGQAVPQVRQITKYVWQWMAIDGLAIRTFDSENEARNYIKQGNPGTLTVVPQNEQTP